MVEIKKLLDTFDGELYDLCYKLIDDNDNPSQVFKYVCENLKNKPKNGSVSIEKYFSLEEVNEYRTIMGDTVDGLLSSTIKKCNYGLIPPESFYKELWQRYYTNYETKKEIAFAFYYTLIDSKIPYQYYGKPLSIDNDKYEELIDRNEHNIEKLKYIRRSKHDQRTETASLVLHCLEEIEDYESKVVVLAIAFQIFSTKGVTIDELIQQIDSKIEELEQEGENANKIGA